jgi:leader peptidase (prepilin peptidase)/N-methyltransferase
VVLLGKLIFGKKKIAFDVPTDWQLIDAPTDADPVVFSCEGEDIPWDDLFFRKSDELLLECTAIELNGSATGQGLLKIREHEITTPDGTVHRLEDVKSLSGKVTHATIPREAMGMGDPHLLGMIGAFIGGFGVVFTIASSAVFAIIAAVLGRIGLGRPLPYGPFLLLGALAWIFGGWKLWQLYVDWISFR